MNKCCEKCIGLTLEHKCYGPNPDCHTDHPSNKVSQEKPEETTTSQAILLDMYEREGLVGIEKHIAKERTQARNEFGAELRETIIGLRAGKKNAKEGLNVLRDFGYDEALSAVLALLPEQESK